MVSVIKKVIKGNAYYYARKCERVEGKPKIVWQQYLGSAEAMVKASLQVKSPQPTNVTVKDFGAVVALYDLAKRLKMVEIIDNIVPKRGNGPSVGTYLLTAVLNRCLAPVSKAGVAEWFSDTTLSELIDINVKQLSSQRFWDNMDRISIENITEIEKEIVKNIVKEFSIDLSQVIFDATNFFTFIDSFNDRNTIAKRGKSKEQRTSARIVGLAMLIAGDGEIPLLHKTYPGNQHDATTFRSLTDALVNRYRDLIKGSEHITLIFDKGNNAEDNLKTIADSPYHFIGSLIPTHHRDLLAIKKTKFKPLTIPGVTVYRTTKKIFGHERTILITHNDNLYNTQIKTILNIITKCEQRLKKLQTALTERQSGKVKVGKPPTIESLEKQTATILKARHMKELFETTVTKKNKLPHITYKLNKNALTELEENLLGKTILFTDNDDWSDEQIVRGYRAQSHIENDFRTMKDVHHISLRPQYHWTDQKIAVHVFCCVLALTLVCLLRRELKNNNIDQSVSKLLDQLNKIKKVSVMYINKDKRSKPSFKETLSKLSKEQRRLYDTLNLNRYMTT